MENQYEIRGDVVAIFLDSKKHGRCETLIDVKDLPRAASIAHGWYKTTRNYVAASRKGPGGKIEIISLHRFLMLPPYGWQIDHINRNTLDNRRENLRIVLACQNAQNKNNNSRNTSGHRNVYWFRQCKKWGVRIHVGGKGIFGGLFSNIEDAVAEAERMRQKYMAFSVSI